METTTEKDRRTPFLKRENLIVKYKVKTPIEITSPVIKPQTDHHEKQPVRFFRPKPVIKAFAERGPSSFWI